MGSIEPSQRTPRTCLVSMPWHSLNRPSLALGILRANCRAQGIPIPDCYHGSIEFADFMMDAGLTVEDYGTIADAGFQYGLGEWVFAGALNGEDFGYYEMWKFAERNGFSLETTARIRRLAQPFVEQAAAKILAYNPELVGFSSTFSQNVASLAVAARIKQLRPEVLTVIGGYNCDASMGIALHREFPIIDFVLRGEGDLSFPQLLTAIGDPARELDHDKLSAIPGLCWRDHAGKNHVNTVPAPLIAPVKMRGPYYGDWFDTFYASSVSKKVNPLLTVESSRGCWWGEKHHCTFCGLNGSAMQFRAKAPDVFFDEVITLIEKHQVLDIAVIDNILPVNYLDNTLLRLADRNLDLNVHYEIKANLTTDHIQTLQSAGVWHVQPGIESLVDDVLRRMDKGVRSVHNLRTIRDSQSTGLTVNWNWLYGFAGERVDDYDAVVRQVPALVHLQPPLDVSRINLQRFSPNFDRPELGFAERESAEGYRYVYDLPENVLQELLYTFDTPDQGLTEEQIQPLRELVDLWFERYPRSTLTYRELDDVTVIRDRRVGWPQHDYVLDTVAERKTWAQLQHGRSVQGLSRNLAEDGVHWDEAELTTWLCALHKAGLVFTEGGRWLALATSPALVVLRSDTAPRTLIPLKIAA